MINKKAFQEGFSLIEALTALAILSLGTFSCVYGGYKIIDKLQTVRTERTYYSELYQCNNILNNLVGSIQLPFWFKGNYILYQNESLIEIPYVDGIASSSLIFNFDDQGLHCRTNNKSIISFKALNTGKISAIEKHNTIIGIQIDFFHNEKSYPMGFLFGSIPFLPAGNYHE